MKLRGFLVALLLGVAWAGTARAQGFQGPNYLTYDALRNLMVREMNGDRDQVWQYLDVINHQQLLEDSQDSSAVRATRGWNHMGVWLYVTCTGAAAGGSCDSLWASLLALEVRGHTVASNDSISAHPWTRWKMSVAADGAPSPVDTVGYFGNPMTGRLDKVDPATEIAVVAIVKPEELTPARGMFVELRDPRSGAWFSSPYTSIKVRYVEGYNYSGVAQAASLPIRIKADLVGWR